MSDTLARFDSEIARLQAESQAVQYAPPSFEERFPQIERALTEAEAAFRQHGPLLSGQPAVLPEVAYQRHQVMVGAAMVANRKAILDAERARIKAQTEHGISAAAKQRRLDELRASILKAAAKRELALREIERAGEFQPRPVHAELAILKLREIERLAR